SKMMNDRPETCSSPGQCLTRDEAFHEVERSITFSRRQRLGYFLSYNRYALLILLLSLAVPTVLFLFFRWYFWVPATLVALRALYWAWHIARQYPKKLHITKKMALAQQNRTFQNEDIVKYCGDPCYRVVAHQVLAQARVPAGERRRLVREYVEQAHDLAHALVFVDREKGRVVTIINGVKTEQTLTPQEMTNG
ncbi:hypothetical protein KJ612_16230, partial [Myxococcota bacterium]|nr:hypothetical protein [Myxococcota bacterium]